MDIAKLYQSSIHGADRLIDQLGIRSELVQNDTLCLEVSTNERYAELKAELSEMGRWISEKDINGRLIAILELHDPLRARGWSVSFVELPQPKTGTEADGVRHLQFVTRTGIISFRKRFPDLRFSARGNSSNQLLEFTSEDAVIRLHDKNLGTVIELEQAAKP